jgi:hypothetical protein
MAETILCDNCGARLAPEDQFCGECGAPRPTLAPGAVPPQVETQPAPVAVEYEPVPPTVPSPVSKGSSEGKRTAAKVIAILSVVVAIGLCGSGFILALLQPTDIDKTDWLLGTSVCFVCPGLLALVLAVVLWALVVRRK